MTAKSGSSGDGPSLGTSPAEKSAARGSENVSEDVTKDVMEQVVRLYGDLIFDLCTSTLRNGAGAQFAFRSIVKELKSTARRDAYETHQRAWALRVTIQQLRMLQPSHGVRLTPDELIALDSETNLDRRLAQFDRYFQRIPLDDQVLLLLRDKYGIPYPEIAAAVGLPEGSLQVQRRQALRALEESIWGAR